MVDVFPRRDLGQSDYWGRIVEHRIESVEKSLGYSQSSLGGLGRSSDALLGDLARQIERLEDTIDAIPVSTGNSTSTSGFSLATGWNTVLSLSLPVPEGKTSASVSAEANVNVRDEGPTGAGTFQWPFPLEYVTSEYGYRPEGEGIGFHSGIDFAGGPASSGSPIYAPGSGTVIGKGFDSGRGNYINLGHPGGITTRYFHMISASPLGIGDPVTKGSTVLGYVGNTGASFGAHLHWETYVTGEPLNPEGYAAMDPRDFMAIYGGSGGGEFASIASRIVISGSSSLEFQPFQIFYSGAPGVSENYLYPQHGQVFAGASTVSVNLDVYASADVPSDGFNGASLTVEGVFS